ncbi:MAG TPA: IS3 family transposase [Methylomirabilota bacterium]|nr:IS3 family transposase [Methylomirabilota bacterium]
MTRRRALRVVEADAALLPRIQQLKAEHPFWGYRRIWAYLRFVEQRPVNKKRVLRLMREHHLLVQPNRRLKAKRTPMGSKPRPTKSNEWWGIDMTKVLAPGVGWVYIVVVLDWYTKVMVGYYAGIQCKSQDWLSALDMAVNGQFPHGARGQGLSLMNDNGCQPTSLAFLRACATLEIHQAFTSYNNPKGHADTERVMRTLKEECLWLQEWTSPVTLARALATWIDDYNEHYLHSALGYKPPRQFERDYPLSHGTQLPAA